MLDGVIIDLSEELEKSVLGRLLKLAAGGVQFSFKMIGRDEGETAKGQ